MEEIMRWFITKTSGPYFGVGIINSVFTLGQATKEDIAVIDQKKIESA